MRELLFGLKYCPQSGLLFSNVAKGRWRPRLVRTIHSNGYRCIERGNKLLFHHRIAFMLMNKEEFPERRMVDHINGNILDNRWVNLRIVTYRENGTNYTYHRAGKTVGVFRTKTGRYHAVATVKGKGVFIGAADTEEEAVDMRSRFIAALPYDN